MNDRLKGVLERLQEVTKECNPDMRETYNKGIRAHVVGDHLDNLDGDRASETRIRLQVQELILYIANEAAVESFNLADIVALARMAK